MSRVVEDKSGLKMDMSASTGCYDQKLVRLANVKAKAGKLTDAGHDTLAIKLDVFPRCLHCSCMSMEIQDVETSVAGTRTLNGITLTSVSKETDATVWLRLDHKGVN